MTQEPLHLLCIEPRFPGRLGAVADWLVQRRGYRCRFLCADAEPPDLWPITTGKGLEVVRCPVAASRRDDAAGTQEVFQLVPMRVSAGSSTLSWARAAKDRMAVTARFGGPTRCGRVE